MKCRALNILFLTAHFPYPLIGGERIKSYHIIKHLAANHKVWLLSYDKGICPDTNDINKIRELGVEVELIHLDTKAALRKSAVNTLWRHPIEVEFFMNSEFKRSIQKIIDENKIDLGISFFLRTAEYLSNIDIKKILILEDCRTLYQKGVSNASQNLFQKAVRTWDYYKMRKYEPALLNHFDCTTVVTEYEKCFLQSLNSKAPIEILSNGVNHIDFCPNGKYSNEKRIIFTGRLDMWVNRMILQRLINKIFPKIQQIVPDSKLQIVGYNPPKDINKNRMSGIEIISNVSSIIPYIQNAALMLNPHFGGSGIQNKVLEAMSCGCPVVTTNSGARGIGIIDGTNGFITDSDSGLIEKAVLLLNDSNLRKKLGANAREYILRNHRWEDILNELDEIIENIINYS
ncbi:MAG: hypothetical protein QG635_1597 [Bacteroidota bacterium]|nr:hypothetical protein [Bacteroidota bacterium]